MSFIGGTEEKATRGFRAHIGAWAKGITQEHIILFVAAVLFFLFSILIPGFTSRAHIYMLLRNVSVLGIFAVGMAIVVIARGIDLSQVAVGIMSAAWTIKLINEGAGIGYAVVLGLLLATLIGLLNGYLIAFIEIPALFATLATGICTYGFVRKFLLSDLNNQRLPETCKSLILIGRGDVLGIPLPIVGFMVIVGLIHLFLRRTKYGNFLYAQGDNEATAQITGIPYRPMKLLQYSISTFIGYIAALIMGSTAGVITVRTANSTFIFEVLLVVVLGGVSLTGGRGSMLSVIAGTLLIGILVYGMILMGFSTIAQDFMKGVVLLAVILLDTLLHPRDEETARQGDI